MTDEIIIPARGVRSLVWDGDSLVDVAAGWRRYALDGSEDSGRVNYAYPFDAAQIVGDFALIYTRFGTKALLLKNGEIIRELNRTFYHASAYEYPICLARHAGRTLLIHCPDAYNRLEIDDAETGERLTKRESQSRDFFHSRLAMNPGGTRLLSAGWIWHPCDYVAFFDLEQALAEPAHLDSIDWSAEGLHDVDLADECCVAWQSDARVLFGRGRDANDVIVFDIEADRILSSTALGAATPGVVMPVGDTHVVAFHTHPRLIRLADGTIEREWPHIRSGAQTGGIVMKPEERTPPLALDRAHRRFAIAQDDGIHVLSC